MGHERVGCLPKTKRWRDVVGAISSVAHADHDAGELAASTLKNVRERYEAIHQDGGVQAAFGFLIALASSSEPDESRIAGVDPGLNENPSPLTLARRLQQWIGDRAGSLEYAALAQKAASDAIAYWTRQQARQGELFAHGDDAALTWSRASNAAGFCEISRVFFGKFTERYLGYFLGREAGAEVDSVGGRRSFDQALARHVDDVARHAFELSKITQSFAAGWYNNHAREGRPSDQEVRTFLRVAFGKLQEELLREAMH